MIEPSLTEIIYQYSAGQHAKIKPYENCKILKDNRDNNTNIEIKVREQKKKQLYQCHFYVGSCNREDIFIL